MTGTGGTDRTYDLGTGHGDPQEKCRGCSGDTGQFSVHEAGAGAGISDHVGVLDPDASGSGIYAAAP